MTPPSTIAPDPSPSQLRLTVVGPGRVGRTVTQALRSRGHDVVLVARGQSIPRSGLTWLTVPDRAVAQVSALVPLGGVVLHASGALDLSPLQPHEHAGSLHPLMTFPGPELASPNFAGLPAAVDGDEVARNAAHKLARAMGWSTFDVSGDRRLYHASAVVAGNFATVLLGAAAELLAAAGVPASEAPALLLPLARTSLENAAKVGPARALTGPVARGDHAVIQGHRAAIQERCPHLLPVYDALAAAAVDLLRTP